MPRRSVELLIQDMLERIGRIQRFVAGLGREAFLADPMVIDSVVRNLEVIGEAANRVPRDFQDSHPDIPWRRIVGLRHRVVHEYFDVDLELVWEIAQSEIPVLQEQLRRLASGGVDGEPAA